MPITSIIDDQKNDISKSFQNALKSNNKTICFYYMNGCYHCTLLIPIWLKVLSEYDSKKINIINIEQKSLNKLQEKYKVYAFPTIIVYENGEKKMEYNGSRNEESLHNFIKEHGMITPKSKSNALSDKNKKNKNIISKKKEK